MLQSYVKHICITFVFSLAVVLLMALKPGDGVGFLQSIYYLVAGTFFVGTCIFFGKLFRDFTVPEAFLTSGAIETFKTKVFWMVGPQLIGGLIGLIFTAGLHKNLFERDSGLQDAASAVNPLFSSASAPKVKSTSSDLDVVKEDVKGSAVDTMHGYVELIEVDREIKLIFNGVEKIIGDGYGAGFKSLYSMSGKVVLFGEVNTGAAACPAQFFFVEISDLGATSTPLFGTCSDLVESKSTGPVIYVTMPNADGGSSSYTYQDGVINEIKVQGEEFVSAGEGGVDVPAIINDRDGYTNLRAGKSASSQVVGMVRKEEVFYTMPRDEAWWRVRTHAGGNGYMHKSRIQTLASPRTSISDCPTMNLLSKIQEADKLCQDLKDDNACSNFVDAFDKLIPSYNCKRPFDDAPVPALWLAGDRAVEQYVNNISRLDSARAKEITSSSRFAKLLDGSMSKGPSSSAF